MVGEPLKPQFKKAFEYSDCWVDDSRLVVLNARDAAARGAEIHTRLRCVSAIAKDDYWQLLLRDEATGRSRDVSAKVLINAAGPWVSEVLRHVIGQNEAAAVRLVKGSHIVVPRLFDHDRCYIFQNADGRIIFAITFEQDFTLLGTTDLDYEGDPSAAIASAEEIDYLCSAASEYFAKPIAPVLWSGLMPACGPCMTTGPAARTRRPATMCFASKTRSTSRRSSTFSAARSPRFGGFPNLP